MPRSEAAKEANRARARKWAREHPEEHKARCRAWHANPINKARVRARQKVKRADPAYREELRAYERKRLGLPDPTRPCPSLCECCGGPPNAQRGLALDHCHAANTFRGWLCARCNKAIGALGDTIEGLEKAIAYLRRAS